MGVLKRLSVPFFFGGFMEKPGRMPRTILLVAVLLIPVAALAGSQLPPPDVVSDNPQLFIWFLGLLLAAFCFSISIIGYLLHRGMNQNARNSDKQWNKLDNHETRIGHVEGALRGKP